MLVSTNIILNQPLFQFRISKSKKNEINANSAVF